MMHNRCSVTTLGALLVLVVSFFAVNVHAFQMGEMKSHSRMGEPVDATVGIWLSPGDAAQPLRFKISPDISYSRNARLTQLIDSLEARLERNADGIPYIHITSATPISEPIVAFRLKVFADDVAISRNYALVLNPPAVTAQPRVDAPRPRSNRSETAVISGPTYTVSRGDSLWGIARRISRTTGANTATVAEQIFAANPRAFVDGNQNKIMLGALLHLPGATTIETETPAADTAATQSPRTTAADEIPAPAEPAVDIAVYSTTINEDQGAVSETLKTATRRQSRSPELSAELEALKEKYAALKARYDSQPKRTDIAAETATGPAKLQALAESPTVRSTAPQIIKEPQSEPPFLSVPNASSADQSVTDGGLVMAPLAQAFGSMFASTSSQLVALFVLAVIAVTLVYYGIHRTIVTTRKRHTERRHHAQEENRKAEVAAKAKNRIEVETEVQRMLERRGSGDVTEEPQVATVGGGSLTAETTDAEIDTNIAHGRYAEAEALLADVIATTPRNYSAKLRLIEVYYMTEKTDEFCQLADDLHQEHRADMADEEWRRVIRMGKIIAPDRVPFSGPRAVSNPTQVS